MGIIRAALAVHYRTFAAIAFIDRRKRCQQICNGPNPREPTQSIAQRRQSSHSAHQLHASVVDITTSHRESRYQPHYFNGETSASTVAIVGAIVLATVSWSTQSRAQQPVIRVKTDETQIRAEPRPPVAIERRAMRREFLVSEVRAPDIGISFDPAATDSLVIADIAPAGRVAQLGFEEGDRILEVNGVKVTRETDFIKLSFCRPRPARAHSRCCSFARTRKRSSAWSRRCWSRSMWRCGMTHSSNSASSSTIATTTALSSGK